MKKVKILTSIVPFLVLLSSMVFSNSLSLNGLGARAVAMGGAFVGISDDFSSIFWNPAGIAQFRKKTLGLNGELIIPSNTYEFLSAFETTAITNKYPVGMAAFIIPISKNMVMGMGIYNQTSLRYKWNGEDLKLLTQNTSYEWESYSGTVTISPALAYKISDQFFVGATLNINHGIFDIKRPAGITPVPTTPGTFFPFDLGQQQVNMEGWGYGATIGILIKPIKQLNIGATFSTANKIKYSGVSSISNFPLLGYSDSSDLDGDITWPMSFCIGTAFHLIKNFTLAVDLHYTNWKKMDVIKFSFKDAGWNAKLTDRGSDEILMHRENSVQIRLGVEYVLKNFAFRGGYLRDPAPGPDETMNIIFPTFDLNVITFGIGYSFKGFQIDSSIEYTMAEDRDISILEKESMPGKYRMNSLAIGLSFSLSF